MTSKLDGIWSSRQREHNAIIIVQKIQFQYQHGEIWKHNSMIIRFVIWAILDQ